MYTNENIQNPYKYEAKAPYDHFGRILVSAVASEKQQAEVLEQRLAPAVAEWDRTLIACDVARQAFQSEAGPKQ